MQMIGKGDAETAATCRSSSEGQGQTRRQLPDAPEDEAMIDGGISLIMNSSVTSLIKGNSHQEVKGERREKIGGPQSLSIGGDKKQKIGGGNHLSVGGDQNVKVGGTQSLTAGTDLQQKVGQNAALDAGQEIHIKAGMKVIIEAGAQLSLKGSKTRLGLGDCSWTHNARVRPSSCPMLPSKSTRSHHPSPVFALVSVYSFPMFFVVFPPGRRGL